MGARKLDDELLGQKAPDFCLEGPEGQICLKDLIGHWVVLYFYPRDNTPGCTQEACDFRDRHQELSGRGIKVIGISTDSVASHQKFQAKHQLPFPLLSDEGAEVSRQYRVYKEKNLYGKIHYGIERSTFVIDPEGIVREVYRKVKVAGHVGDILDQVVSIS